MRALQFSTKLWVRKQGLTGGTDARGAFCNTMLGAFGAGKLGLMAAVHKILRCTKYCGAMLTGSGGMAVSLGLGADHSRGDSRGKCKHAAPPSQQCAPTQRPPHFTYLKTRVELIEATGAQASHSPLAVGHTDTLLVASDMSTQSNHR